MGDIWARVANVPVHLAHDAYVLVAIKKRVLFVLDSSTPATMGSSICLQTCIRQHHYQALSVLVVGSDRDVLLRDQSW